MNYESYELSTSKTEHIIYCLAKFVSVLLKAKESPQDYKAKLYCFESSSPQCSRTKNV